MTNHHAHSCHLATWWLLVIVHNHVHRCLPPCDQVTAVRCAHHWLLSCSQVAADPHAHPWLLPCRQRTANPGRAAKTQLQLQLDLALLQKIMVPERAGNTRPTPAFHALRMIFAEINYAAESPISPASASMHRDPVATIEGCWRRFSKTSWPNAAFHMLLHYSPRPNCRN